MSFWIIVDDSVQTDELLAGAGAAALAAGFAELVSDLARTRLRVRARWLWPALRLPADIVRDTGVVLAALGRVLLTGEQPESVFREVPVRSGPATADGRSRRALIIGGTSLAPNTFALGIDAERQVMVVHQLVTEDESESK